MVAKKKTTKAKTCCSKKHEEKIKKLEKENKELKKVNKEMQTIAKKVIEEQKNEIEQLIEEAYVAGYADALEDVEEKAYAMDVYLEKAAVQFEKEYEQKIAKATKATPKKKTTKKKAAPKKAAKKKTTKKTTRKTKK